MIDPKLLRDNPETVRRAMHDRGVDVDINEIVRLDGQYRHVLQELEDARAEQNKGSLSAETAEDRAGLKNLKHRIQSIEIRLQELKLHLDAQMASLPNIPLPETPIGDASANVVEHVWGEKPEFDFDPKHYMDIAEPLGLVDMETGAKVSGARFGYLKGDMARLQFALQQYAIASLTDATFIAGIVKENGLGIADTPFQPVIPPVLIRPEMMRAMGFSERLGADRGSDELYWLPKDELYLVGTSEQSLGPMHFNEIIEAGDLPIRYVGFSTSFRREAGAAGKDTRGILRVHQFNKIEMFTVSAPESSPEEHQLMLAIEEKLMQGLGLHYRVVRLATGDLGAASASTFDIETWMPGQGEYRETHSTSNTTDFQSRALKTRYRTDDGSTAFVHMLNGTVFSERPSIAILEQYQNADGTVRIPDVLRPFMGGAKRIGA